MTDRMVQNKKTGEIFIETKTANWRECLTAWELNHRDKPETPCPMPKGHIMFTDAKAPQSTWQYV
jgi:hypothetical protein